MSLVKVMVEQTQNSVNSVNSTVNITAHSNDENENYYGIDLSNTFLIYVDFDDFTFPGTKLKADCKTWIVKQKQDTSLKTLFAQAVSEAGSNVFPVCHYLHNGVLMRKWRPAADVLADDIWQARTQIVVSSEYRNDILSLAHDISLAGHLGVRKTKRRILLARSSQGRFTVS